MGVLLNVNGGHVFLRVVNVTCTDLAWFTFILYRVYHDIEMDRETLQVFSWMPHKYCKSLTFVTRQTSSP